MTVKELRDKLATFSDDEIVHFQCDNPYEENEMDEVFPNWKEDRMISLDYISK